MFKQLSGSFFLLTLASGCSASPQRAVHDDTEAQTPQGLGYSGAIASRGILELSAPITPDAQEFVYPTSQEKRLALVLDHTYSYERLLQICADSYPGIKTTSEGAPLSASDLIANYELTSRCAYERFGAKPYWVPQLLLDVDVCASVLGAEWRLPSEEDVRTFTEEDFQLFSDTMTITKGDDWFPRQLYYSLEVFVRGTDGRLVAGDLNPGADHLVPLSGLDMNKVYEGAGQPLVVRCVRFAGR